MVIIFADKKLAKVANDDRKRDREYGSIRSGKIKLRLSQLSAATVLEDVRNLAGNYHELRENRKGEWACDLDQPYRLIFKPIEHPIPLNKNGQYDWNAITGITIIEIVNYHKE